MNSANDERFAVYIRLDPNHGETPNQSVEQPLAICSTYQEAKSLRRQLQGGSTGEYVIRYLGPTGGGD
jgi:hypothetical protein